VICPRCFHNIGEHLLCREHGGEDGWSAGAYQWKPPARDLPPREALSNVNHVWFSFIDRTGPMVEAIP